MIKKIRVDILWTALKYLCIFCIHCLVYIIELIQVQYLSNLDASKQFPSCISSLPILRMQH